MSAATRKTKLGLYSRRGVDKWIVDWPLRKIDLYRWAKPGWSYPRHLRAAVLTSPRLPDFTLKGRRGFSRTAGRLRTRRPERH